MDNPSADSLVTDTTATDTSAPPVKPEDAPFTQPHPDPAAKLDPAKAGQRVSSPHVEHGAKPARKRNPTKAVKAKKRTAADIAAAAAKKAAKAAHSAAASSNQASVDGGKAAYAAAVAHEVPSFAQLPEGASLDLHIASGDMFLDGVIEGVCGEIVAAPNGHTYTKDVDIGPDGPPVSVTEVWLVAQSGEAVRCPVGPLSGGGGYHVKIPAGHLKF